MKHQKQGCIGIIARLGSKRLHDKHLIELKGIPIIAYLIERIKYEFSDEINQSLLEVIILTGDRGNNSRLDTVANQCGISIYYGDNNNIPKSK